MKFSFQRTIVFSIALVLAACDSGGPSSSAGGPIDPPAQPPAASCELPTNQIVNGGPGKDGIPALTNPPFVPAGTVDYLSDDDRVIGLSIDGQPVAIPHNILWWHEIANFDVPGGGFAVTYCPLTGSSIVFDRAAVGGAELGVSGLLYNNNLIMYDRNEDEALWSQMLMGAGCASSKEVALSTFAHVEMTWAGWRTLHPDTQVISSNTGFTRNYTRYPYGSYENLNNPDLLFRQPPIDERRPPKERVLGIPGEAGRAMAFPFGKLDQLGAIKAVKANFEGQEVLVLWDRDKNSATAFRPRTTGGQSVEITDDGSRFVDAETGSVWQLDGLAVSGGLAGQQLEPIAEAYTAFWFAWATFHPQVNIFGGE